MRISIHTLLTECDDTCKGFVSSRKDFNPHTPYGVWHAIIFGLKLDDLFQSTHSLRSVTMPRSKFDVIFPISIHTLLTECDPSYLLGFDANIISIHTLLTECDGAAVAWFSVAYNFNPHTPYGVWPQDDLCSAAQMKFQSTHSLRSVTWLTHQKLIVQQEFQSTHSLRSVTKYHCHCGLLNKFQSTHSLRSVTVVTLWSLMIW